MSMDSSMMATGSMTHDSMMSGSTDSMMMSGSMMTHDSMASHSTMSMSHKPRGSVIFVAKYYGYTWKTDRLTLAKMAGITNYRGTTKQNLTIRNYLLQMNTMMK